MYLSANTRQETIETFLKETWEKVQERARTIHSGQLFKHVGCAIGVHCSRTRETGQAVFEGRNAEEIVQLKALAESLVKNEYHVSHFMIDKSLSELNGIRAGMISML